MDKREFLKLYDKLPRSLTKSQSKVGQYFGRNAYSISGYGTGRNEVPVEIANLLRCMVALHQAGLLEPMLPNMDQKKSLVN